MCSNNTDDNNTDGMGGYPTSITDLSILLRYFAPEKKYNLPKGATVSSIVLAVNKAMESNPELRNKFSALDTDGIAWGILPYTQEEYSIIIEYLELGINQLNEQGI